MTKDVERPGWFCLSQSDAILKNSGQMFRKNCVWVSELFLGWQESTKEWSNQHEESVCKMMTKIPRHEQKKSRISEGVPGKAQYPRDWSYVVLASCGQRLLLFFCKDRIGADVYKISECGICRIKSIRYCQKADR